MIRPHRGIERHGTALLLWVALAGCSDATACEGETCGCDPAGTAAQCCSGWLERDASGACVARAWPPEQRFRLGGPSASNVEVGVDGLGRALVSWQVFRDGVARRTKLAEQNGDAWQMHTLGPEDSGFGARATISTRGLEAWISWTQHATAGTDETAVFLLRRDATGRWSTDDEGERLSFPPKAYEPRPVLASTGENVIVWNQWRDGDQGGGYGVGLGRQGPDDDALTLPASASDVLSPNVFFSNAPQIAVGTNGDAVVVWYQATPVPEAIDPTPQSAGLRIFVSERTRTSGTFSRPAVDAWISPPGPPVASHSIRNPVVAVGSFGETLVFWSQEHPSGRTGLFSASRDGLGEWTTPDDIDDTFGPLREDASCIDVVLSPTREAFVTWFDGPAGATSIYGAHRDEHGDWDEPRTLRLSTAGRAAIDPRIAVGPDGEAVVLWSEQTTAGRWAVMARRRGPQATFWGEAVELSDPTSGDAVAPAVAIGADGTFVAAWTAGPFAAQVVEGTTLP